MTNISINRHTVNDAVLRIAVAGEVDLSTSDLLATTIRDAITAGHVAELVVDLDQVTFLDSTGIRALITGHNLAAERGVAYHVTNPHNIVRETLDIAGVLPILTE